MTDRTVNDHVWDLVVVGGGINGAGIACDAAGRGLSVALCEQDDLSGATSSASSKLIHGGLRYLEHREFRLVREALGEREVMLSKAPHIIRPMRFVLPHRTQVRPAWLVRLGLFLYDHLAAHPRLPNCQAIDLNLDPAGAPLRDGVNKGFVYSDCWVDDARLVVFNAMQAANNGATILTRTKLVKASRAEGLWRARLLDGPSGGERTVWARALVNATGPWVREVLDETIGTVGENGILLVKGSHIVVPRLHDGDHGYILQNADRRVVFVLPYESRFSLVGTTDIAVEGDPGHPAIDGDEVRYLCESVNGYFKKPIAPDDVVWSYSGIRPLYNDHRKDPSKTTREYVLDLDARQGQAPILSVFGGKITTYRRLAEQALERLRPFLSAMGPPWTAAAPLPGGDIPAQDFAGFVREIRGTYPGLDREFLRALARRHGTLIHNVLGNAATPNDLGQDFGGGLCQREAHYLMVNEWARTAEDILWRRTKAGLRMAAAGRAEVARYVARQQTKLKIGNAR